MNYNVDYFIDFFKAKRSSRWTTYRFRHKGGFPFMRWQYCALGHLMYGNSYEVSVEAQGALNRIFHNLNLTVPMVNDVEWTSVNPRTLLGRYMLDYTLAPAELLERLTKCNSPKKRILAVLYYAKEQEVIEQKKREQEAHVEKLLAFLERDNKAPRPKALLTYQNQ